MIEPEDTADESERLNRLRAYDILDTPSERAFDDITKLASMICGTPIALVSLVDECRQWFKSRVGLEAPETERRVAFCAHAIHYPEGIVVNDTLKDERFHDNPLVTGDPMIRFYAGSPLIDPEGFSLGTLCVIDVEPRELTPMQTQALRVLSHQVVAQMEMRRSLKEAADLDAMKTRFLANVSHELRTPLNSILGFSGRMLRKFDEYTPEKSKDHLGRIHNNGRRLLKLIDSLLDLSRIEAGKVRIEFRRFRPASLVREIVKSMDVQIAERNIRVEVEAIEDFELESDPDKFEQIVVNLLANACKFVPEQTGLVRIAMETEGELFVVRVVDNGEGIAAHELSRIFEAFVQAGVGESGGTGLGLAISRGLANALGGSLAVESSPGAGAEFILRLPARRD